MNDGVLTVVTGGAPTTSESVSTAAFPGNLGGSLQAIKYLRLRNFNAGADAACNGTGGGNVICAFQWDFTGVYKNGTNTGVNMYGYVGNATPANTDKNLFTAAGGHTAVSAAAVHSTTTTGAMTIFQKILYTTASTLTKTTTKNSWYFTGPATAANTAFVPQCGMTVKQSYILDGGAVTSVTAPTGSTTSGLTCHCKVSAPTINTAGTELSLTMDISGFGANPSSVGIMFKEQVDTLPTGITAVSTLAHTKAITETALTTAAAVSYGWDATTAITTDKFDKFTYMVFQAGANSNGTVATTAALKLTIPSTKTDTIWSAFDTSCNAGDVYAVPYCFDTARTAAAGGVPASTASNPQMLSTNEPEPVKVVGCGGSSAAAGGPVAWVSMFVLMNLVSASFS